MSIKPFLFIMVFVAVLGFDSNALSTNRPIVKHGVEKVIISGTIKDDNGKPLEKAKVVFDSTEVATTDKDGKYSFDPGEITPTVHKIYFSCDSFGTAVRTYYPVMSSANFDIILRRPFGKITQASNEPFHIVKPVDKDTFHIVANPTVATVPSTPVHTIIKDSVVTKTPVKEKELPKEKEPAITTTPVTSDVLDLPSILFKENQTGLSAQDKVFLDIISQKLKNNTAANVDIRAYTRSHEVDPSVAKKRLANIVRFLVEKGIAEKRLNKVTVPGGGDENTIDIILSN